MARLACWCGWVVGLLVAVSPALADEEWAAVMYELFYEPDVRKVRTTPSMADDVALAREMAKTAMAENDSDMVLLLCRDAYELGQRTPKGYEAAAAALETLKKHYPKQTDECNEKLIVLRRKQFYSPGASERESVAKALVAVLAEQADRLAKKSKYSEAGKLVRQAIAVALAAKMAPQPDLNARLKRYAAVARIQAQIQQCQAKLRADPKDASARQRLTMLYLVDLDDPAAAAECVSDNSDEVLRTYIPLAGRKVADLEPEVCLELGMWYFGLGEKASASAKGAMMARAKTYLESFLARDTKGGLAATRARARLVLVEQRLRSSGS